MSLIFYLPLLFIKLSFSTCDNLSLNNSNCSLSFTIQTIYQSNKIQTNFPIEFLANYNLTCDIQNLTAYYKITPLAILVVGYYKNEDINIKSMVELHTAQFHFNINQSSTIRLCILSSNDDDDDDDNDNDHRICRQIHIGINTLYDFWNLPMRIFYIFLICSISSYYILFFLRDKWRKGGKNSKSKASIVRPLPVSENKRDTFENEKVHEEDMSGEEDEE
jgi:hypothetical protein